MTYKKAMIVFYWFFNMIKNNYFCLENNCNCNYLHLFKYSIQLTLKLTSLTLSNYITIDMGVSVRKST